MKALPKARRSDLVVTELENELLVYDVKTHRALCLNESAAAIWKKCDGKSSTEEIAASTLIDKTLVKMALGDLSANKLLDGGMVAKTDRVTRRKVLLGAATALAVVPVILTIVAPAAAQANSCIAPFNATVGTSTSAQPANQACNNATAKCCSNSASQLMDSVDVNGNHTCTGICGSIVG
jgi:hypothetical protein